MSSLCRDPISKTYHISIYYGNGRRDRFSLRTGEEGDEHPRPGKLDGAREYEHDGDLLQEAEESHAMRYYKKDPIMNGSLHQMKNSGTVS